MSYTTIVLDGREIDPDTEYAAGWWIDDNTVTVRTEHSLSVYRLPKGRARVTVTRLGGDKSQLIIGGFTTITVSVIGPFDAINRLRKAVL